MLKEYKKTSINNVIRGWQYKDCAILLIQFILVWIFAKFSNNPPFNDISAIGILIVIFFVLVYAFYSTKKMLKKDIDKIIFETIDKSEEETKQIESLSSNQKDFLKESFTKLKETEELVLSLKEELASIDNQISTTKEKTLNSLNSTNEEHITVKANVEKMFVIRHKMQTIAELILELSEFIQSISSTIGIVEDIAEQTNLLALNAAVEAARAGEHGKGFAVVAGEIRKLADESKQATTKITSLINDIQQTTNSTVIATEEGTKEIETGIELAHNIGSNIENLTSQINEIVSGVNGIYSFSNKMTRETSETEKCVNELNLILSGASGTLDESNKKLENLNAISKSFKNTVVEE